MAVKEIASTPPETRRDPRPEPIDVLYCRVPHYLAVAVREAARHEALTINGMVREILRSWYREQQEAQKSA